MAKIKKTLPLSSKELPLSSLLEMVDPFLYDMQAIYEIDLLDDFINNSKFLFFIDDENSIYCISESVYESDGLDTIGSNLIDSNSVIDLSQDWFTFIDLAVMIESSFLYILDKLTERMRYLDGYGRSDAYNILKSKLNNGLIQNESF